MGMEEGCLSFSVPNICLYKQLCGVPPPSEPGLQAWGGSALFIWRGQFPCASGVGWRGMAAALDSGSPGRVASAPSSSTAGWCLAERATALQSHLVDPSSALFASCVALDRLLNLSEPLFPPLPAGDAHSTPYQISRGVNPRGRCCQQCSLQKALAFRVPRTFSVITTKFVSPGL